MNIIYRDIFRAIHEGKWLAIEYRNKDEKVTRYWMGIEKIYIKEKMLSGDGLHTGEYKLSKLKVHIDRILSAKVVEGSYYPVNEKLVNDIYINPHKYLTI